MTELDYRFVRVVLAADAFTRSPDDREAFNDLCGACEQIADSELSALLLEEPDAV